MSTADGIIIGKAAGPVVLNPRYANRHGLIAGATGTGKTVTLQVLSVWPQDAQRRCVDAKHAILK
jgi:DNA segregation ATPase FtsK/SpoIIIE-like protein